MSNQRNNIPLHRMTSLFLILALMISFAPISAYAQQAYSTVPFLIDDTVYYVELQFIDNTLYCRVDQWAQAAECLWNVNSEQKTAFLYYDTPVILDSYNHNEYVMDGDIPWIPFFEAANETGIYFTSVENGTVHGYRAKPLAVFYDDMDRMFGVSKYRITELILQLGVFWNSISTVSRLYAVAASGLISGFVDSVSGKMEQDIYDEIFVELLITDESLIGAITGFGNELTRLGKAINMVQKSLDENGTFVELLEKMGFSENEIREIVWDASQAAYGDKYLNDLSDLYEIEKVTNLLKVMGMIDNMAAQIEADTHTVMAIQGVFENSESTRVYNAARKAIALRMEGDGTALQKYTFEQVGSYLLDETVNAFEEVYEEYRDIGSLEKLAAKVLTWAYDEALSLTDKSNAVMYSEAYSQIQMELVDYYYDHRDDDSPDNGLMMHSVALLYLRSCLASWKMFEFDNALEQPINNAKITLESEISNLMTYTEEELLQNGTSEECSQSIIDLVCSLSENISSQAELFDETYWLMSFGQSLGYNYVAKFSADGTFVARGMGSGAYEDGTYTYSKGKLVIVFDIDGFGYPSTIEYSGNKDVFTSLDKYPMQVGEDYYTISPDNSGSQFFNEGLGQESSNNSQTLSDGEYFGLLSDWNSDTMTIELLNYDGRHEQSFNYLLTPTGKTCKLDISQAAVRLERAWSNDGRDIKYKSIDAALNTEIWGGGTTLREVCTFEIYFTVGNGIVSEIVFLYAA